MEHNVYYDGKIQSLGFRSDKGEATVGVVEVGQYDMPTDCVEHITILSGKGRVKLPDTDWREVNAGDQVTLPANANITWDVVSANVCYLCVFGE